MTEGGWKGAPVGSVPPHRKADDTVFEPGTYLQQGLLTHVLCFIADGVHCGTHVGQQTRRQAGRAHGAKGTGLSGRGRHHAQHNRLLNTHTPTPRPHPPLRVRVPLE